MLLWFPDPLAPLRHIITFSVRLRPKAWTRAQPFLKGGRMIVVKAKDDRAWQADFREEFIRKMSRDGHLGLFPWHGPIVLQAYFLYYPPKNWWPGKEKTSIPDADNLGKQVLDALKPKAVGGFGAFIDDRQVILPAPHKFYHPKGDAVVTTMRLYEDVEKPRKQRGGKTS